MSFNKQILFTAIVLISTIVFFALTSVDIMVQDLFYDKVSQTWILNRDAEPYKFIFYDGIKQVVIAIALVCLLSLIFYRLPLIKEYKKGIIVIILSAILIPLVVGGLKKYTNMPCPKNEIHFGGEYPRTAVWESYAKGFQADSMRCWPAGHASGGFALLSFFFLFKSKKNRYRALYIALVVGWSMGVYKMLIGDHFLSHTMITMILAWLIVLINAKIVYRK